MFAFIAAQYGSGHKVSKSLSWMLCYRSVHILGQPQYISSLETFRKPRMLNRIHRGKSQLQRTLAGGLGGLKPRNSEMHWSRFFGTRKILLHPCERWHGD